MPHPGTQELARRMQAVPRTSRGFQTLLPEVRSLRTTLLSQGDKSGLTDLAEKVRLWAPGEKMPAVTARALAEAADVLADAGQWERAAQLLERAVQTNPLDMTVVDRAHTVLMRGKAFVELHDLLTDHALLLDRRAPNELALRAGAWQRVGKLRAEKLRNIDAAIAAYDTAMQIQPEVAAVRDLAVLLEQRGQGDDRDGAADLYCLLGELVGGDEGAIYYARALNLRPDHPEALAQLGAPEASRIDVRQAAPVAHDDSRLAATVLQFPPANARPSAAPVQSAARASSLPPPALRASSSLPPPARPLSERPPAQRPVQQVAHSVASPFAATVAQVSRPSPVEASIMAPLPTAPALDVVRAPVPSIPYVADPSPSRTSVAPVQMAPSVAPQQPYSPTAAEDTWSHDRPGRAAGRRWIPYVGGLATVAALATFAFMRRDLVESWLGKARTQFASAPASTDSVTGGASGAESRVEVPQPVAAQPVAAQPTPAVEPEKPVAAAPKTDKAEEKPEPKGGEVSLEKGSLRAKGGRLPHGSLTKALDPTIEHFDACYDRALAKKPRLAGSVTFTWVVKPSGKVDKVQKGADSLKDAAVAACVQRALKQTDFPKPKGGVVRMRGSFAFKK